MDQRDHPNDSETKRQRRLAEQLARGAHADQTDKAGRPYVEHLERVAGRMHDDGEQAVAWLHDILEDTTTTAEDLTRNGVQTAIVADVEALTREPHERYAGYIERLRSAGSARAVAVKLADLADHLEHHPEAIDAGLKRRYRHARKRLKTATNQTHAGR